MASVARAAALMDLSRPFTREDFVVSRGGTEIALLDLIAEAATERTMTGASTITLDLVDPEWSLLSSPLLASNRPGRDGRPRKLSRDVLLVVDELRFALSEADKNDKGEQLVFYDETVARLKGRSAARKASRNGSTRAQFAARLCREARVEFVSPDRDIRQPVADLPADDVKKLRDSRKDRRKHRDERETSTRGALTRKGLTIKGVRIDAEQRRNLITALTVADEEGAKDKARLAMVLAGIGESGFRSIMNQAGSPYGGVFQGNVRAGVFAVGDTEGMARCFLRGGKGFQAGGAIALARAEPGISAGAVADRVEAGGAGGAFYDRHRDEALKLLEAWGGGDIGGSRVGTPDHAFVRRYEFRVERGEDWWDTLTRLAEEVGWRCFAVGNRVWFASDFTLIRQPESMVVRQGENGVDKIRWLATAGQRIDQLEVTCRLTKWGAPPGAVVIVEGEGPLADGRWLVRTAPRAFLDASGAAVITLGQPQAPRPEPASQVVTIEGEEPAETTTLRGGKVRARDLRGKTPKQIIDRIVLPLAAENGVSRSVAENDAANHRHGPTSSGGRSDHQGPPELAWAADLPATGATGDKLAQALAEAFGFPGNGAGSYDRHSLAGYSIQILWKVEDHYDHVHVGIQDP